MSIIFPINPLQGAQYTPPGIPVTWQYDSGRNAWRVVRGAVAWADIGGKPSEFPPSDHFHEIEDVTGLQDILDVKQDISARGMPSGYAPLDETGKVPENMIPDTELGDWNDIGGKPSEFPPTPHSHPVVEISDSSSIGQQIVRATNAYDVRQITGSIGPDENARVEVNKAGVSVGLRRALNFIEGSNVTLEISDDATDEEIDIRINASGSGGGGSALIVSETKPAAPFANDMWLDTATGILFVYYNDGAKHQWIESIPYLSALPTVFNKFVFPVAPTDGQIYEPVAGTKWVWGVARGVWFASLSISGSYTKLEADAKFVDLAGDAMTGALTLNANPTANLQAAPKQYVDARVLKAGDTMTGPLVLPGNPVAALDAVPKQYVDAKPSLLISDVPPPTPLDGTLWWESDSGILYVRYNDGSGAQWVQAVAVPAIDAAAFVQKAGDTMAGHLSLPTGPAAANAVRKDYADTKVAKTGDTMTGDLTLPGPPTVALHAATKAYVDLMGGNIVVKLRWFTASTTYVPDPKLVMAIIETIGGGGAGGYAFGSANWTFAGGGGGGGAYCRKCLTAAQIGASITVTVGAGGVPTGGTGGAGGATSFGGLCVANGGGGGLRGDISTLPRGGAGGGTGPGDFGANGEPGHIGILVASLTLFFDGGSGGSSVYGPGGGSNMTWSDSYTAGLPGTAPGGGGSGGNVNNSPGAGATAGAGAIGCCIVTEFCKP